MIKETHGWNLNTAVTDAESENLIECTCPRCCYYAHENDEDLSDLKHKYPETGHNQHIEVEKLGDT